jgi:plasmid stabilization system protein ParE
MRLLVSKTAEREVDAIFVYWGNRAGVAVADRLVEGIEERFALLGDFPHAGGKCDEISPGMHRFSAGEYWIYYRMGRGSVHILHILHGAQSQARACKKV